MSISEATPPTNVVDEYVIEVEPPVVFANK
jgi:hypothetical protein